MTTAVRVGTRGSLLALTQTRQIVRVLRRANPGTRFEIVTVKTYGDEYRSMEIFRKTSIGVFTKELERALLDRRIDLAVHSLKDLPTSLPKGLMLAAVPRREDARDVLVTRQRAFLEQLPERARVGTGSPRRRTQLLLARPDLRISDLRGNLDTRVNLVLKGRLDAVVVAAAGLKRIRRYTRYVRPIPETVLLPAVGQGSLALQCRASDRRVRAVCRAVHDLDSALRVNAERAFLSRLHGGCRVPAGISTRRDGRRLSLRACVLSVARPAKLEVELTGSPTRPENLGRRAAEALLRMGAGAYLRQARSGAR
ncbi:MAG: Porphobilinogen deaminase [Candidatus Omnitrophica bacterium]|nr:Porphobilinogen deaminase [Candidatus Omnitrophota bacterium]